MKKGMYGVVIPMITPMNEDGDVGYHPHVVQVCGRTSFPERRYPSTDDPYDYHPFFEKLSEINYHDTLTIEADVPKDWNAAYRQFEKVFEEK